MIIHRSVFNFLVRVIKSTKPIQKAKKTFAHTVRTPALLQLIIGFWCSVWCWKLTHAAVRRTLSRGKCRDSCGHACTDWKSRRLWGARFYSFSAGRWDLRLFLRKRQALAWKCSVARQCTYAYCSADTRLAAWEIPLEHLWASSIHPDLAPSNFFVFQKMKERFAGKLFANDEGLKDAGWVTRQPHGMKKVYINWCQGTTNALMSKATM